MASPLESELYLLCKGLPDAIFKTREGCSVTCRAEADEVCLRVVLITVFEIAGERDVLDVAWSMNLHEGFGYCLEGASLAGAGVDYGVSGLSGVVVLFFGEQAGEEHVDVSEVIDEDEVAALFTVCVAA